ncbi:holo-[acyl-carrier-protein] synthase [Candidatus Marinimicrobia bacterium MT.SAG.2]|nr:holo-[acyl-carrier-protein] synthase [Candidatus Marinimicrobia bacterium MT.SAG.2]
MTEVGIDIIEIARIGDALSRWDNKFRKMVFTASEIEFCEARSNPVQHYAARFAAKEAVAKALKSSKTLFLKWTDVEIVSHENGAPTISLHGESETLFNDFKLSLSLSHSVNSAIAVAILSDK